MGLMKTLLLLCAVTALSAIDIPGGSEAVVEGVKEAGLIKIVNGRRIYYASVEAVRGFEPKANGKGCILFIDSDKGVQPVDVSSSEAQVIAALVLARD